jgi:hypothetical protein
LKRLITLGFFVVLFMGLPILLLTRSSSADSPLIPPGQEPPTNVSPPTMAGTPTSGQTLSANAGDWDGPGIHFTYAWLRCDGIGGSCQPITNADDPQYFLAAADVGSTVRVLVLGTNQNGAATVFSDQTAMVSDPASPPTNTSPPVLSGAAQESQALSASAGSWEGTTPLTYAYSWKRCDAAGSACIAVDGATDASYTLVAADVGKTLRVFVTASNSAGSATAESAASSVVTGQLRDSPLWDWAAPNYALGWTNDPSAPDHWQAGISNGASGLNSNYLYTVDDGAGGSATRLRIAPTQQSTTHGTMTTLFNPMPDRTCQAFGQNVPCGAYTERGEDAWYHSRIRFPSGIYVPRSGSWNMVQEWHESRYGSTATSCPTYPSANVGVQADPSSDPLHNQGQNPRLVFEFRGGHVNSDGTGIENNFVVPERDASGSVKPLQYDHWYDVVVHYKWEPDTSGQFEWYVDGVLQYRNLAIATMHVFCDGTSYPDTFGIYNYQRDDGAWPSGVDFRSMAIGPTVASVGFTP